MWGQDNRCLPAAAVVQRFTDIKTKSAVHEGEIIMLGNHLLGIYEKALNPEDDWHKRLKKARDLGFDFMEICIDENDMRLARLEWTREEREELSRAIYETGVPLLSMCLSAHRRFPFGSADPAIREKAYLIMDQAIDFAVDLGIRTIQIAGYDVYYEESTFDSRRLFFEGLQWAAAQASRKGVMLANEIMDTAFLNSITKHLFYEKQISSPWLKVYPDVGNLSAWGNDIVAELEKGRGSIVQVHLKDTLTVTDTFEGQFKNVPFGKGCVNFPLCFSTLEKMGYTGPYLIEMWYHEGQNDMETVGHAKAWIEKQYAQATEG